MEVKQGYKQTEVGVIPEDWDIIELGKSGVFSKGSGVRKDQSNSGEIACVRYGELYTKHNNYIKTFHSFISKEVSLQAKKLKKGDILFAGSGETKAEIGKSAAFIDDIEVYAGGDIVILTPKEFDSLYLGYLLNASFIQAQKASRGQGDAVVHISSNNLSTIKIPQPSLTEQTAIAFALSDMDALISQTEKLIEKKKAIKQGAMQELLKPKEGWLKTCLIELAEGKKQQFDDGDWVESEFIVENGEVRLIQTGNIGIGKFLDKNSKKFINNTSFYYLNCKEVIEGDLLICRLAEPAGRACIMPNIGEEKVITSVDVTIFRGAKNIINREYLQQLFSSKIWFKKVSEKVGGTTHKRISRSSLGKIEILLPKIQEQNRIADILSTMDKDIDLQLKKLTKLKQQKQGMMQALLTGQIRLI
jgi:type I restriction enzyme, S subunit